MISKAKIKMKNLNLVSSTSVGMKAGQFLFLGSQTPMDLETGKLVKGFRSRDREAGNSFCRTEKGGADPG